MCFWLPELFSGALLNQKKNNPPSVFLMADWLRQLVAGSTVKIMYQDFFAMLSHFVKRLNKRFERFDLT